MKLSVLKSLVTVAIASGLLLGLCPGRAAAMPITFDFSGTVGVVPSSLSSAFTSGQTIAGSYTFESTTPNTSPPSLPFRGIYNGTLSAFSVTVGANTWTLATPGANNFIFVDNDASTSDAYQMTVNSLSGPSVGGATPLFFSLRLVDLTGTAFSGLALPPAPPNLAGFDFVYTNLVFDDGTTSPPGFSSQLNTLNTPNAVPEPSTMLLLGSGLVGLGYAKRRLGR